MGIKEILFKINLFRQKLNTLYLVEKTKRDIMWNEQVQHLSNEYKKSLNEIKFGKIKTAYQFNLEEINKAAKHGLIKGEVLDNFMYNNELSKLRDIHPVLFIIINNKVYYLVETTSPKAVKKPLVDELDIDTIIKEFITVKATSKQFYLSKAIYVIEAKDSIDLSNIIENVENNTKLKDSFLGNKDELTILSTKEKAFELFYKNFLNKEAIALDESVFDMEDLNSDKPLVHNVKEISKVSFIDVTFDKYIKDNVDRVSKYKIYYKESFEEYLNFYKIEEGKNKNDSTDI